MAVRRKATKASTSRNPEGRPREYSEQMLIDAAIQVMLRDGYKALTARSLAAQLGISHTALYTYVGSVRDIEDSAKRQLTDQLPRPQSSSRPELRRELIAFLVAMQRILLADPGAFFTKPGPAKPDIFHVIGDQWKQALLPCAPDSETLDIALSALLGAVLLLVEAERFLKRDAGQVKRNSPGKKTPAGMPTKKAIEEYLGKLVTLVLPGLSSTGKHAKAGSRRNPVH